MRKVIIVGGGSAGWMSAAFLSKTLGKSIDITLVESDAIAPVGVGEATIPPIQLFNKLLNISEPEFMAATQATFKLGIQFENWGSAGEQYMHAFGPTGTQLGLTPFIHYWLRSRKSGVTTALNTYSFNAQAALNNKFKHGVKPTAPGNPTLAYAFHFDATAYANLLRQISVQQGVTRKVGTICDVVKNNESGDIEQLKLDDGSALTGDLFIDCSGQRSLLLGDALEAKFECWQHWLPCDRAIAVHSDAKIRAPYTRGLAHDGGWQWQIPLQNRTGNGIVYSSAHSSDEDALLTLSNNLPGQAITQPNKIIFKVGRYKEQWKNNCIAIGLASGFLEPLESTSLHMVQSSLVRLVKLFPQAKIAQSTINAFNRQATIEAESIRDFIILHYYQNQKSNLPLWQQCRRMSLPASLEERLIAFKETAHLSRVNDELFDENAWSQVLIGQGLIPDNYHPIADHMPQMQLDQFLRSLASQTEKYSETLPDHAIYVNNYTNNTEVKHYA